MWDKAPPFIIILGAVKNPETEKTNYKSNNCFTWAISLRIFMFLLIISLVCILEIEQYQLENC